jgi:hypothetical protein
VRHGHDSIFSKEGTGGELVVGDGGGVGEAPGSAKLWVDEVYSKFLSPRRSCS